MSATWTIVYRKHTANRFIRPLNFMGTWAQAIVLARAFKKAFPQLDVEVMTTRHAELTGEVATEDILNVLVESGKRVKIVDRDEIPEEVLAQAPSAEKAQKAWDSGAKPSAAANEGDRSLIGAPVRVSGPNGGRGVVTDVSEGGGIVHVRMAGGRMLVTDSINIALISEGRATPNLAIVIPNIEDADATTVEGGHSRAYIVPSGTELSDLDVEAIDYFDVPDTEDQAAWEIGFRAAVARAGWIITSDIVIGGYFVFAPTVARESINIAPMEGQV